MSGRTRRLLTVAVVAAVVAPALRNVDSYPLSTYPMYASARDRVETFLTARGFADGEERRLSMAVIADTDDPLVAQARLDSAVSAGAADALCAEVARRAPADVDTVEVVSERHDVVAHAAGRSSLLERQILARCAP